MRKLILAAGLIASLSGCAGLTVSGYGYPVSGSVRYSTPVYSYPYYPSYPYYYYNRGGYGHPGHYGYPRYHR